ncbi:hypothetical protein PROFUN_01107 [Planoprotostelium fungivorum]|uniref:Uncharacterized protein n=1 Tax=Planoprotostelium fungivorum TaxID=1890364 RepID=A0A2P6NCC5_9EUKA|nr:hypothetical protein PROFUN_01107 [Planoprotostelium fungivorum]
MKRSFADNSYPIRNPATHISIYSVFEGEGSSINLGRVLPFLLTTGRCVNCLLISSTSSSKAFLATLAYFTSVSRLPTENKEDMSAPPKFEKLRGLLFDIDGTLAETDSIHFDIFKEVLIPFGYNVDHEFYQAKVSGRHNPVIFRELLPKEYTTQQVLDFGEEKEAVFRQHISSGKSKLDPTLGLLELLQSNKEYNDSIKRTPVGVSLRSVRSICVTNACRANAEFMVDHLKVADYFESIVIGDECERGKPHPDPYLEGMKRIGVSGYECVAFEDSPAGVRSAAAAGIKVIVGIMSTQTEETLKAAGATYFVSDFSGITLKLLDELLQKA